MRGDREIKKGKKKTGSEVGGGRWWRSGCSAHFHELTGRGSATSREPAQTPACFISKNGKSVGCSHSDWHLHANTSQPITPFTKNQLLRAWRSLQNLSLFCCAENNCESQGPAWLTFNFQEHFMAGETFPLHLVLDFQPRLRLSKPFPRSQKVPVNQQCGSTVRVRPGATDQPNLFS